MSTETANKPSSTMSDKIVETLGDIVVASLEATAQISLGQGLLRLADRFLWVVEKSAQWSLPVHELNAEENGKTFGKIELVRPLPWIFFLPSLVILRACRLGINVGAVILGYPQLQPTGMVKFIQKGRRRLRTIKSNGLKTMRYRKNSRNKEEELTEAKKSLIKSMLSTLSALSCLEASKRNPSPPPTRLCVQRSSEPETTPTPEEKSTTESTSPQVDPKRKYSEITTELDDSSEILSEEESTEVKLEKFGAILDSESDDQDFDPAGEEMASEDTISGEEEGGDDDYLSESEVTDLLVDNMLNPIVVESSIVRADVIIEEPEPEAESLPQPGPEVDQTGMNKISTPNKMQPVEKKLLDPLEMPKETENDKLRQDEQLTPIILETDGENIANYFSPINSPDSISDFTSPYPENDDSGKDLTPKLTVEGKENKIGSKVHQIKDRETHVDNGLEVVEPNENPAIIISGISPDEGQSTSSAITNGTTDGDNRRDNHTTGISEHNGKYTELPQGKEK